MTVEQEMMNLASERSRAMKLAAEAGKFLADPEGTADSPKLKKLAEQTLDAALDVIRNTTKTIKKLRRQS